MLSQADEATIIIPSSPIFREKQEQLAQGKNYSLLVKIFGSSKKNCTYSLVLNVTHMPNETQPSALGQNNGLS